MFRKKILSLLDKSILLEDSLKEEIKETLNDLSIDGQRGLYKKLLTENFRIKGFIFDNIKTEEDVEKFKNMIFSAKQGMYKKEEELENNGDSENILKKL